MATNDYAAAKLPQFTVKMYLPDLTAAWCRMLWLMLNTPPRGSA